MAEVRVTFFGIYGMGICVVNVDVVRNKHAVSENHGLHGPNISPLTDIAPSTDPYHSPSRVGKQAAFDP